MAMLKSILSGSLLAAAAFPTMAAAQDGEKLDCITRTAAPELKASIVETTVRSMREGQESVAAEKKDALAARFWQVITNCAAKQSVDREESSHYFDYSHARIMREWVMAQAKEIGVSFDLVDKIFDFGPGRTNADFIGIALDERLADVRTAYLARGVGLDQLDGKVFEQVGIYVVVTPIYWNARKALGQ
ncbi:hypothetical protein [Sphingopyxis macrogoltabida]|nr:hypothetical protein [Sphingopyxis macrogoltabida]